MSEPRKRKPNRKPKVPQPLLRTPDEDLSKTERHKMEANYARGSLHEEFRDHEKDDLTEFAQLTAKSHGIYTEYNRAKTGREKDWMYMVRVGVPGGGSFTREQWRIFDEAADKYGNASPYGSPSLRVTTRQNIQFHWVKKPQVIPLVQDIAKTGYFTRNGCGDNTRNVMGCPLSRFSDIYDANAKAQEMASYFLLPSDPYIQIFAVDPEKVRDQPAQKKYDYGRKLLNRKFKLAFSAVHRNPETGVIEPDNCVELRTNEIGIAPIVEDEQVVAYYTYIGGSQGEKNGKPTFAAHGVPFGVFTEENLLKGLHDIVKVHEEWGDRKNRHWARMKYVVHAQGVEWFRDRVRERGADFELPDPDFDPGPRQLHHGWHTLPENGPGAGKLAYGAYIESGRLVDSEEGEDAEHLSGNVTGNGNVKSMVRTVMEEFDGVEIMTTPNQDLLFTHIDPAAKEDFEARLADFGHGQRKGRAYSTLRVLSGACVGLPTCRLSYTDSEQFEPELIDQLEQMGYGEMHESIGITGCERQCFRPATKTIGWIGQGPNMYGLKIGGSEDARHQGFWLVEEGKWYLRQCTRENVATVTAALFDYYLAHRLYEDEDMGAFHRRVGASAIIDHLKQKPETAPLMEKTPAAPYQPNLQNVSDASCAAAAPA